MAVKKSAADGEAARTIDLRLGRSFETRPERQGIEGVWLTAHAFYMGRQRFKYIDGHIYNPPYSDDGLDTHYKVNLVMARVQSAVAKILGIHAEFACAPESGSAKHREQASMSLKVFDHQRGAAEVRQTDILSQLQSAIYGSSITKVQWNPRMGEPNRFYYATAGSKAVIPEMMLSQPERNEKVALDLFNDVPSGDVEFSVVMPFGFHHDWSARDAGIRKCLWVAEKHRVDIPAIAEAFNVDEADITPDNGGAGAQAYEEALAFISTAGGQGGMSAQEEPRDKTGKRCTFVEMWERPNAHNKRGRRLCFGGGRVLLDTANPYISDKTGWSHLPYVKKDWTPAPGRFWGKGLAEELVTGQYYLNDVVSRQIEFIRTYGLPDTYVGDQAGIRPAEIEEGGGRIYQVSEASGFKVQHGPAPQMPIEVGNVRMSIEADINKVAAQAEMDGAKMPAQLRSGAAVRQMNEERFVGLNIPGEMYVMAARDCGRISLALGQMFYGPERVMRFLGEDNDWVVETFSGMDLRNDIVIVGKPTMTDTVANKKQEMLDAIQAGAFNPQLDPESRRLIISGLHYNTSEEFIGNALRAKRNQEREIQEMVSDPLKWGISGYPVMPWEDHEAEAAACVAYMYTSEFRKLDPKTQGLITLHWQMHANALMAAAQEAADIAATQKGAPGKPGMASQPKQ